MPFVSSAERKGFSPEAIRLVQALRRRLSADLGTKRAATLRSVRTGVSGPNGAARAQATEGSQTRGGAVAVEAVDAASCGALGCRQSDELVAVEEGSERRVLCPAHARRWSR